MAKMIPPIIDGQIISDGEHDLFQAFKTSADTSDWVVLHSLDVAKHQTQVVGEIDFVIIVPQLGVVCLEVKACRSLEIVDGRWRYGQNKKWDSRGPFKQASRAMQSLREQISKKHPKLRNVVFWSAVAFTHMSFASSSPEWHHWQLIDQDYIKSRGIVATILGVLKNGRIRLAQTPTAKWFKPENDKPNGDEIDYLINVLRPNFESYESPKARIQRVRAEAKRYTEDQFRALDFAEDNERVVFSGPAGTGKTLLAIESARRAARLGRRTLFLCYNELLGDWLENEIAPLAPIVEFDRVARRMLSVSGLRAKEDPNFWAKELPLAAVAALQDDPEGSLRQYEELIVDEAQDFLRDGFLEFLDHCVDGGLEQGRVRLFGDFERQAVYHSAELTLSELKEGWIQDLASFRLRNNCRNTPRVAALAGQLGGLDPDYQSVLRQDDLIDPMIIEYEDEAEQPGKLMDALLELLDEGFGVAEIVVLSMRSKKMCMDKALGDAPNSQNFGAVKTAKNGVFSSSVRRFKGLEAPVIVLTDVESISSDEAQTLLYVAVTRTLSKLVLLMRKDAKKEFLNKISEGMR
jgi:hypothetical protein